MEPHLKDDESRTVQLSICMEMLIIVYPLGKVTVQKAVSVPSQEHEAQRAAAAIKRGRPGRTDGCFAEKPLGFLPGLSTPV